MVEGRYARSARTFLSKYIEGWEWRQDGPGRYSSKEGILNLDRDDKATILRAMKRGWERELISGDNRCKAQDTNRRMRGGRYPVLGAHAKFIRDAYCHLPTAIGAAQDHRAIQTFCKQQRRRDPAFGAPAVNCVCGMANPDRRHWMWTCSSAAEPMTINRDPRCEIEKALAVPLSPQPIPPHLRECLMHVNFRNRLRAALLAASESYHGKVLVATDGSGKGIGWFSVASIGIAFEGFEGATEVYGLSQNPGVAEIHAAKETILAAAHVGKSVHLLIDNFNVVRQLQRFVQGEAKLPQYSYADWFEIRQAMQAGCDFRVDWVPSHGKKLEWRPPGGFEADVVLWRQLNDLADKAAGKVSAAAFGVRVHAADQALEAELAWATAVLTKLHNASTTWIKDWKARHGPEPASQVASGADGAAPPPGGPGVHR